MEFKLRTNAKYFNNDDILADLRRVAKELGKNSVSNHEYPKYGKFSTKVFRNRFGSWNKALEAAGLMQSKETNISSEVLFENLEKVWLTLGRQPFYGEMKKPLSKYTTKPYVARWGGWMKACEAFIKYKGNSVEFQRLFNSKSVSATRSISEKLRLHVYKRDNYVCVICGRSPANERGVILHVDHIVPFSLGGKTELDNLRTLCSKCNLGKSNEKDL